ncbi:DUF3253 domain-containing protein [Woodsholea maritima]|uniref:DUF3253 domain-containing protein n=1 Tax=Woodsholea maritima TaxID=240237 RepID=UPI0003751F35|nr:DUF3253 domain-containing protein [Woodsholea maritima]
MTEHDPSNESPQHVDPIETAILDLVRQCPADKSIDPAEAAKLAYPGDWQGRMKAVKAMAVGLARKGQISILRKGKPVDPNTFKGVYRISAPREMPLESSEDGSGSEDSPNA